MTRARFKIAKGFRHLSTVSLCAGITDEMLDQLSPAAPAITFLKKLRPGGPWVLTAIMPDSPGSKTLTVRTSDQIETFVCQHDGKANLYYALNPTRTPLNKKARKTDIAAIEYLPEDLDPADGETSEAAKARYLAQLNGASPACAGANPQPDQGVPRPTALVDSGNGLNGLVRLKPRIELGKPVNGKLSPEDQAKINDAEARAANMMRRLGAKAGTQNIDRILRLPGTTNLPNARKRREGRVACQAKLLWFDDVSYPLEAFPRENGGAPPGPGATPPKKFTIAEGFKKLGTTSLGKGVVVRQVPPLPLEPILAECGWLREAYETGGRDYDNPQWNLTTLCATWIENGHELAHELGNRHPDYTHEETEKEWERKNRERKEKDVGWPSCEAIRNAGSKHCETCPHFAAHLAEGKSPLHLAWQAPAEPPLAPIAWDPAELRVSFSNVRHRPWLYGPYLVRGEVTIIAAPGGVGKTALTTGIATAIATGTVLMDDKIWGTNLKVLSINGEDGKAEVTRRMWAFARAHAHQIAVEAPERFYAIGAEDDRVQRMAFLQTVKGVSRLDTTGFAILESALDAIRPDVVMLDPFVVFCSGGNMNDGPVMAQVMRKLKSLAIKYDCSILVVHHNRKGGERDDQESISGAAAIVNLARCAIMPVPMTKEETKEFGVLPSERHRYFRLVNAKPNFTPKSEDSPWYQLHSIEIPNPEPPLYDHGDNVQAVARVELPLPKPASEAADDRKIQQAILDLVDRGKLIDGVRYPYNANVTGAKNMRALLDDAMAAVRDATPLRLRPWHSDDLRAVVHAAIDRMKVEGRLFEEAIEKGRFRGSSALYAKRSKPTSPTNGGTAADTPEEAEDET